MDQRGYTNGSTLPTLVPPPGHEEIMVLSGEEESEEHG